MSPLLRGESRHRGEPRFDGVTFLTIYLVALFAIQSRFVVRAIGAAGSPAQILAILGLVWWVYYQVQRPVPSPFGRQPVRLALWFVLMTFTASYVAAMRRPIDASESSTANLGLLQVLGWFGVVLLVHDGIPTRARFDRFTQRLVWATAALALLGVAQFVTSNALVDSIHVPGLVANAPSALADRSGYPRPAGTALHPIEFGAVLTTVLPLAITRARTRPRDEAGAAQRWLPVVVIGLGIVLSDSRSAVLCTFVGLLVLSVAWPAVDRVLGGIVVLALLAFVALTIPGMLGTITRLFTGFSEDGSIQSRTGSYSLVAEFFARAPTFGRGYSTFLPSYRILDNQWLLLVVEVGAAGVLAFLGLLVVACICAAQVRREATDARTKETAQALLAGIVASAVGLATYDGLSFPMATSVLFVVMGLAGCLRRLVTSPRGPDIPAGQLAGWTEQILEVEERGRA